MMMIDELGDVFFIMYLIPIGGMNACVSHCVTGGHVYVSWSSSELSYVERRRNFILFCM